MSSNLPPGQPGPGGPSDPGGPNGPEYLESGTGTPVGPTHAGQVKSDSRKRVLVLGGLVGGLAVAGGVAWAATSFFATGSQPAEALPATTLGYLSVDLDPSGGQKIEAIRTLQKFPAIDEQLNLDTDDDLRERLVEELVKSGECEGLDYAEDVEPWVGSRAAVAAVDAGEETPTMVFVMQVSGEDAATEGIATVQEKCGGSAEEQAGGFVVAGEWLIGAESEEIAQGIVDDAENGTLADDDDFNRWTGEAGDAGIMTMYASPAAGQAIGGLLEQFGGMGGMSPMDGLEGAPGMEFNPETGEFEETEPTDPSGSETVPPEMLKQLEDFQGAAGTLRFQDGGLEFELAAGGGEQAQQVLATDGAGGDGVADLPADTIAAVGLGFADGWFTQMLDQFAATSGMSAEEMIAELNAQSGLDLPADAETIVGDAITFSLGGDFSADAAVNGGPADIPVGVSIDGDPAEIEAVLEKIRPQLGPEGELLATEVDDDTVIISPNEAYRATLAEGGDLGDSDAYKSVLDGIDDPSAVVFVNFDAGSWLDDLAEQAGDAELSANLEPLSAFGVAGWQDGEVSHSIIRLTTN